MPRRKPRGRPLDGWLIIDKPPGLTSTDVVNRVRRAFDAQKAGHGGTLDPLATGVLPIAFGAATKTVPYVMDGTKLYRFTLRFGEARDTDDADGKVTATSPVRPTRRADPRRTAGQFRGDIMQVPPTFSAVKVAGERAYDMAREGRPPNLEPRPARVDRFELIERPNPDTAIFEVASGKGVYMRSLARDLAQRLRHSRPYRGAAPPPRRPVHRGPGDTPGQTPRDRRYRARFPGPAASGRDRAGRHPGAGLDRSGGQRPEARPGDQPGHADGPHSWFGRSRWRVGPRHGGGPRDRAGPAGRRLDEARRGCCDSYPRRPSRCRLPRSAARR